MTLTEAPAEGSAPVEEAYETWKMVLRDVGAPGDRGAETACVSCTKPCPALYGTEQASAGPAKALGDPSSLDSNSTSTSVPRPAALLSTAAHDAADGVHEGGPPSCPCSSAWRPAPCCAHAAEVPGPEVLSIPSSVTARVPPAADAASFTASSAGPFPFHLAGGGASAPVAPWPRMSRGTSAGPFARRSSAARNAFALWSDGGMALRPAERGGAGEAAGPGSGRGPGTAGGGCAALGPSAPFF